MQYASVSGTEKHLNVKDSENIIQFIHIFTTAFLPAEVNKTVLSSSHTDEAHTDIDTGTHHTHKQGASITTAMTGVYVLNAIEQDEMGYLLEIQDHSLQNRIELLPTSATFWS